MKKSSLIHKAVSNKVFVHAHLILVDKGKRMNCLQKNGDSRYETSEIRQVVEVYFPRISHLGLAHTRAGSVRLHSRWLPRRLRDRCRMRPPFACVITSVTSSHQRGASFYIASPTFFFYLWKPADSSPICCTLLGSGFIGNRTINNRMAIMAGCHLQTVYAFLRLFLSAYPVKRDGRWKGYSIIKSGLGRFCIFRRKIEVCIAFIVAI